MLVPPRLCGDRKGLAVGGTQTSPNLLLAERIGEPHRHCVLLLRQVVKLLLRGLVSGLRRLGQPLDGRPVRTRATYPNAIQIGEAVVQLRDQAPKNEPRSPIAGTLPLMKFGSALMKPPSSKPKKPAHPCRHAPDTPLDMTSNTPAMAPPTFS